MHVDQSNSIGCQKAREIQQLDTVKLNRAFAARPGQREPAGFPPRVEMDIGSNQ